MVSGIVKLFCFGTHDVVGLSLKGLMLKEFQVLPMKIERMMPGLRKEPG